MNWETHLNAVLEQLITRQYQTSINTEQLIHCIDLTLLEENAPIDSIGHLRTLAIQNQVAAICVLSQQLHLFVPIDYFKIATVANFPKGNNEITASLNEIDLAVERGAQEIDFVLPYQTYLAGHKTHSLKQCETIIQHCKNNRLTLKIILETGAFPDIQSIYQVSGELIRLGCDFLKTSTGKIKQGSLICSSVCYFKRD